MAEDYDLISVVVAVFNERPTLEELVKRITTTMEAQRGDFEILLVDDGSEDDTVAIARRIEAGDPRVRVFELTRNFGQNSALACGLFEARGEVMVTLDGDLQNPPEEIPKLLDGISRGAAVATGARAQRYEGFVRWIGSRAVHWMARLLTGSQIRDFGGNFRAYRRDVIEAIRSSWATGKPLLPLAVWLGFPVVEIVVQHNPRWQGRSRYTVLKLLRINLDLITSFTTVPMAIMGLMGIVTAAAGGGGLLYCWMRPVPGWLAAATSLTLLLIGSMFAAAGLLGQYLARVYKVIGGQPAYVVARRPERDRSAS